MLSLFADMPVCKKAKKNGFGVAFIAYKTSAQNNFVMFWVCKVACRNQKEQKTTFSALKLKWQAKKEGERNLWAWSNKNRGIYIQVEMRYFEI